MSTIFSRGENPLKADKLNTAFSERVSRAGDTMQGMLRLAADPVAAFDAATKQYVDRFTSMGVPAGAYIGAAPPGNVLGPLWWDTNSGQLFIQYDDGTSVQWVSANSIDASQLEGSFLPLTGGEVSGTVHGPEFSSPPGTNLVISSGGDNTFITIGSPNYGIGSIGYFDFASATRGMRIHDTTTTQYLRGTQQTYAFGATVPPATTYFNTNYTGTYSGAGGGAVPHQWAIASDTADLRNTTAGGFAVAQFTHQFGGPGTIGPRSVIRSFLTTAGNYDDSITNQQHTVGEFWAQMQHNTGGTSVASNATTRGYAYGMNPQVTLLPGATNWSLANALGEVNIGISASTQPVTLGGTVTAGNTLTITLASSVIPGSPVAVSFVTGASQTLAMVANNLVAAINANVALQIARVAATRSGNVVCLHWQGQDTVTPSVSVSGGATTTLTLGAFIAGASVYSKFMGTMVRLAGDGGDGAGESAFLALGAQSAPTSGQLRYGIMVGNEWSIRRDGTVFGIAAPQMVHMATARSDPFPPQFCAYGMDLHYANYTKANGAAYWSPGFIDRGNGVLEIRNTVFMATSTGATLDIPGKVASAVAIAAGGGGGSGSAINNYFIGDLVQDAYGGQYEVATVNPATGAVTGLTVLVYPATVGVIPGSPITTIGGSGVGLTLTVTWPAAGRTLSLNPTGGAVLMSGQINWGQAAVTNPQDTSRHITLWDSGTANFTYGFSVSNDASLNYNTTNGVHSFYQGTTLLARITSTGIAIGANKVIGSQIAGWGTSTGGARGAVTAASTLPQVAAALSQLLTDLKTHGMLAT